MSATAQQVLDVARRNLGVVEGKNNSNPYAPIAGHANNQPWCASFVVACGRKAGTGVKFGNESAYTPSLFGSMTEVKFADVRPGDLIFFKWPSMGRIAHVGIVESKGTNYVLTIEGNTDEVGGRTGGKVMRKKRTLSGTYFARPSYTAPPAPKPAPAKPKADPVLRQGNRGQAVVNMQNALRKHGFKIVADGDFGPGTRKAVVAFQAKKHLAADGICGQATWNALRAAP